MSFHNTVYVKTLIQGSVINCTQLNLDNVTIHGNSISSTDTNGNINLLPGGTGEVILKADPVLPLAVATKQYVDAVASGLSFKAPVVVTTEYALPSYITSGYGTGASLTAVANGSINNSGIDGVTSLVLNERVLVKSEGSISDLHNGVYIISQVGDTSNPWILTRSTDFDEDYEVVTGAYILVTSGVINSDISYVVSTPDPITVDTTGIVFVRFAPVTGENNTISNIGTGGIGLFKQKTLEDLEFKNIGSTSSHISIVDDTVNNEVDVTFDQTHITGTGVLDSGSITSNFGSIDVGASSLTAGTSSFTLLNVDNLRLDSNTIISSNTNGNINIIPNGLGEVLLKTDPVSALGATTKQYVDGIATGLVIKPSARVTTNISLLAYTQTGTGIGATLTADINGSINVIGIDGITDLDVNDRVLIRTNGTISDTHNGVYSITTVGDGSNPWVLTRSMDFSRTEDVTTGAYILITEGTLYEGSSWTVATADPINVDTTAIKFTQFSTPSASMSVSNIGVGGAGFFKQKSGNNFEFRNINSTSAHISITVDSVNEEVDLAFDQTLITGTGAINNGSITSGFGNIDNGVSTITTTGLVTAGSLTVDQITINDSTITYTGNTGDNKIILPINISNGYIITDNTNDYIRLVTTTGSPSVRLLQNVNITGTLTTTGLVNGRNMTTDGTNLDSVMLTGIQDLTATEVNQLENINSVTISNTQWEYLGDMNQAVATTDSATFAQLTVDQFYINDSTLTFTGETTANVITVPNNMVDGLHINDAGGTDYIRLITTDTGKKIELLQDVEFNKRILITDISEPENPSDGEGRLYKKTGNDGIFWKPDNDGVEVDLTTAPQYVRSAITTMESPYIILASDEIVGIDTDTGVVTVTLPKISTIGGSNNYRKYYIVDEGGKSSINNIIVNTTDGDTINKKISPMLITVDHTSITLYNNGTSNWIIL